jgi:D-sedoheptulose 7-phosphate isomerase
METDDLFDARLDEHEAVARAMREAVRAPFARLCAVCLAALDGGGKIVLFGNGGSAADAQHLAAELVVRYRRDRAAMAAIALTTDSSILTAAANDHGFDTVFARQVAALCAAGDVAIGLSTSGESANVIAGLEAARRIGASAAAFSGGSGGRLVGLADPLLIVPSDEVARIQEMHITLGHILCETLELACRG